MRPNALSMLAFLGLAVSSAYAEAGGDASDVFLNAYMSFQRGEKADGAGDANTAIKNFNQAISLLDQVSQRWPTWNPTIVKHRRDRAVEALGKLQAKGPSGRPDADPLNGAPLPENGGEMLPPDSFPTPDRPTAKGPKGAKRPAPTDALASVQQLKDDLETTRQKLEDAEKERTALAKKLADAVKVQKESDAKLEMLTNRAERAEKELLNNEKSGTKSDAELAAMRAEIEKTKKEIRQLQFERDAEAELAEQQASRSKAFSLKANALASERDAVVKQSAEVPKKIQEMQKQIDAVTKEKGELQSRLANVEQQLAQVTAQRDEARTELTKLREASKNVDKLVAENTQLMAKLADAEKQVTTLKSEGVKKDETIKQLNSDVASVRKQLAEAQQQSTQYQTQMNDLRKQLEVQAKELVAVKADATKSAAERDQLTKENSLLRNIVLRAQKTQADKEQTKKLVLEQLAKLNVNSKALANQIDLLGSPVMKLRDNEKKLFKQGSLSISETEIAFGAPKDPAPPENTPPQPETQKIAASEAKEPEVKNEPTSDATGSDVPSPATVPEVKTDDGRKLAEATPAPPKVEAQTVAEKKTEGEKKVADSANLKLEESKPITRDMPLPDELNPLAAAGAGKGKADLLASNKPSTGVSGKNGKKSPAGLLEPELPVKTADSEQPETATGPNVQTSPTPAVPAEIMGLARDAKDQFERGNYREAEKTYDKALAKAPNNLYLLSNKAVVLFREQKYKLAEETFKKAIAIAPEDDFSHCTLGIVEYQQGKFDEAINELTKALAINPKNATAHNYLGITASQKGWQEAAQKELETATAIDPSYADAHFNLAVVFATQTPPNKEAARQHYKRAIELGAEPDSALEQMIK
jgi:tetratricopeptide (TPR) repeat protein